MKLIKLQVNAAGGINPQAPVIIDFTQGKMAVASGDNGAGKTSLLQSLLVALGYKSKDDKDFINFDSEKLDINFEFVGDDRRKYQVRVTKSRFILEYEGEAQPEPITKMKELLGVPGVSPMEIKNKDLKDIVKWLASYTKKGAEEFAAQMAKLKQGIKEAKEARADANRSLKGLREYLENEEMYNDWEGSEKKYAKKVDIKTIAAEQQAAGEVSDKLIKAQEKLRQLKSQKDDLDEQINQLIAKRTELEKQISTGEKFVENNKGAKKVYDDISARYATVAQEAANYEKWQDIKTKKKEMDEFETLSQKADAREKQLLEKVKELQAEIIPDIKGMELVLDDERENGKIVRREGLYRNGVNVAQMSETEWWAVCMEIWRKNKVRILVIDNFQNLGSMGVEIVNKLVKDGTYVLAAEMDRGKKTLEISFK